MKTAYTILVCICLFTAVSCNHQPAEDNEVIENIMARRSIRKYKAEPVDREIITKIMECGINAPNG